MRYEANEHATYITWYINHHGNTQRLTNHETKVLLKEKIGEKNLKVVGHLIPSRIFNYPEIHKISGHLVPGKAFPKEFIYSKIMKISALSH